MAGTVGSHQQGSFANPQNGQTGDASVVLANDNAVRVTTNAHDADATIHIQSSVLASRPAAGTAQRVWITTDGLRAYVDSGSAWGELAYLPSVGGTVSGAVTISSGGLTVSSGTTAVQALTATTGTFAGAGVSVAVDKTAAAGTLGMFNVKRSGTSIGWIGSQVGDQMAILSADAGTILATWTNAGAFTLANGLTVTAGGLTVSSGTTAVQALTATTVTASGNITAGASSGVFFSGRSRLVSNADGEMSVQSNAGAAANLTIAGLTASTGAFSSSVTVSSGLTVGGVGITVSAGGVAITGNSTLTGTLGGLTGLTVDSGGVTVTTGNVTVASGQITASTYIKAAKQGFFGAYDGVGDAGSLIVGNNTIGSATAGAATLPANPAGFLAWHIGGTSIKVPYYN